MGAVGAVAASEAVGTGASMERADSHGHASTRGTSLLQQATDAISSTIDSASRTLSGMLDLHALSEEEARERERGAADAMKMLQQASMIVQMENEDFIEVHAGLWTRMERRTHTYIEKRRRWGRSGSMETWPGRRGPSSCLARMRTLGCGPCLRRDFG